jgi:tellurite resistance protein
VAAEKEAFEELYYPMSTISNIEKFNDFCKGWRAATEAAEALKPSHNTARNAIALVRQFARENGHSEGGVMDQYLDRLEERATASIA